MCTEPQKWVSIFADSGASAFTFHSECFSAQEDLENMLKRIKDHSMKSSVAVKPSDEISEILIKSIENGLVDMVLIMTVNPGFGGQKFIPSAIEKVRFLRNRFPDLIIEVDGGINKDTIQIANEAGANAFVLGTYVFNSTDRKRTIEELRKIIE